MIRLFRHIVFLIAAALLCGSAANAAANYGTRPEVQAFIAEMHDKHGFDRARLNRAFARIKPLPLVIRATLPPRDPAIRSWQTYRARYVEEQRIALGLRFWREHQAALTASSQQSGVPEEIIVAIIGVETIYGRYTGRFGVFAALATLAFDYPDAIPETAPARAALFRHELEELLLLARESRRNPLSIRGSYAGALGLPQFLPSSVRSYAVDGDHDGRIDLDGSPADAIASVANFLQQHGWQKDGAIAIAAQAEGEKIAALLGEDIKPNRTPAELVAFGISSPGAPEEPAALIDLVTPQQPTEYRLGFNNFYVLTRYNRSSFYALAVNDLAETLRRTYR
jgi:membrane-bound lytic murein transglycosylase B